MIQNYLKRKFWVWILLTSQSPSITRLENKFGETTTTVVKRATSIKDPDLHVVVKIYDISKIKGYFYIILQEILALKEADHPGIVKLLEVYRDSQHIYLVMESLEKFTLSYIMEREE